MTPLPDKLPDDLQRYLGLEASDLDNSMASPRGITQSLAGAGIGASPRRPDAEAKVRGDFAYSSDLVGERMLWGATLRSPHPYARIRRVDTAAAQALPGVHAVLTHADVPGEKYAGQERKDCPVLAIDVVRYEGEPVALVAADHPEVARRALGLIAVDYEVLEPLTDSRRAAFDAAAPRLHDGGNVVRHQPVRVGDPDEASADVVVVNTYEVGMQDQAFLGPESGLAVPAADGGVDLQVATQWLHVDRAQVAPCLALPESKVRMTVAGIGGAFGGREDLSMHVHACMLALATGRPVKMSYRRDESFVGHVHRHPAILRYEHGANRDGKLVYVKAEVILNGGAYAATTSAVVANAASLRRAVRRAARRHRRLGCLLQQPSVRGDAGVRRGPGLFAYESQMDAVAAALGLDPVEFRIRNAVSQGSRLPTARSSMRRLLSRRCWRS